MMKKIVLASLFVASLFAVAFLWDKPYILLIVSLGIALVMNYLLAWKYVFFWLICAILGPIAEMICVKYGAWTYAEPQLLGVPFWLAAIWGNASIFFVSLSRKIGL